MGHYRRVMILTPEEVLRYIPPDDWSGGPYRQKFGEWEVNLHSNRLKTFRSKGLRCAGCGVRGAFFAVEFHENSVDSRPHLNLYGVGRHGGEVLMTVDHIIPKAHGGPDDLQNLQPMCRCCNQAKGDKLDA